MTSNPKWFRLGESLMWPVMEMGAATLRAQPFGNAHLAQIPYLALLHLSTCLSASIEANRHHAYSAAICMIRQCVETLTLIDVGLQPPAFAERERLLEAWDAGKRSHGEIRAILEKKVWPSYGSGLWNETWSEYFGNLARAVQPYAHYTPELMGWQMAVRHQDWDNLQFIAEVGPAAKDPLKRTRVTLFHILIIWTIGRLLLAHGGNLDVRTREAEIAELGQALANSKLLFKKQNWADELGAHVLFKPGRDWQDPE